ncbi:MAG: prepilin-type N-terminal cleavage/methylation domain-containing protein [PVC group bacterium]|nr:prepilin-type N-terminal cleavage/methylation domain-containing protein [PVC group bacterium]
MMLRIGTKQSIANSPWSIVKKKPKSKDKGRLLTISHKPSAGFTLIEVMVSVVILAVGLVVIYESFLVSLDTINFFFNRLNAQFFINEKIWQVQQNLDQSSGSFLATQQSGIERIDGRRFNWQINLTLDDVTQELYDVDASISWDEASKSRSIQRATMAKRFFSNAYPLQKKP